MSLPLKFLLYAVLMAYVCIAMAMFKKTTQAKPIARAELIQKLANKTPAEIEAILQEYAIYPKLLLEKPME